MTPLSDGLRARGFPFVKVALIAANFCVWIFYELPNLGASGAIAAVLGAYFVLYPNSRILTLVVVVPVRNPARVFLGLWLLCQLFEGNYGLFSASANGGGVAFFAHVGGFVFGVIAARILTAARPADVGAGDLAHAGAIP